MATTASTSQTTTEGRPARPSVDVVVPFLGSLSALAAVRARLGTLRLRAGDSVRIVDNTPGRGVESVGRRVVESGGGRGVESVGEGVVEVLYATDRQTPGFARNRGAAAGAAEWLVFVDADSAPSEDLLDRYFEPPPGPRTALIGGGVADEPVSADAPPVARYAYLRSVMSQERTFSFGDWGYPKSANVACRREAFEAVGGFREDIRAAEDADLTYRLRAAGWELERREAAAVVHFSRRTLRGLIKQQALWGAGGAWLNRTYPGSVPLAQGAGAVRWALGSTLKGLRSPIRERNRDAVIYALLRPVEALAWELGRLLSNERR